MKRLLSPRDLADAIGVSESSLKRWADAGRIRVTRTEGGHRRIPLAEAVRFIRESGAQVMRPELLGLGETPANEATTADEALFELLCDGNGRDARSLLVGRYLAGESVASLADGPIRTAMHRIGELWRHDARGVFVEHRATDCCLQAVQHLRGLFEPGEGPIALGGAPAGDPYLLPSMLVAAVLASEGMRPVNLGADTPIASLRHAVAHHQPALVWLSVSTTSVPAGLDEEAAALAREVTGGRRTFVVGGRHRQDLPATSRVASMLGSMTELAMFARGLVAAAR